MSTERLKELIATVADAPRALIVTHNDPDPDAIAAALALRMLLEVRLELPVSVVYRGIIGRAENRALVRYLGRPLRRLQGRDLHEETALALVDTQPGTGNNPIKHPENVDIVIDHHPLRPETAEVPFADVRTTCGASSTILTSYLMAAAIEPPQKLATALFYGIKTDTLGLSRGVSETDKDAYFYLQPRVDTEALSEIERAQVPPTYFRSFAQTLQAARIYDNIVIAFIGEMRYPDLGAEMADLLLRLRGTDWVVLTGTFKDHLILSVRSRNRHGGAGRLAQAIIDGQGPAGGHGSMAGGQVALHDKPTEKIAEQIRHNTLRYFRKAPDMKGEPLV